MVIRTIHDLNAQPAPSPSGPPKLVGDAERSPLPEAVHLKLRLQALDRAVSSIRPERYGQADIAKIDNACKTPPPAGTVYVAGSEEFYLVVKGLTQPQAIADVCAEAYKDVLRGRPYVNKYKLSGWTGPISVFSEIQPLLPDIDRVCDTDLESAFARLKEAAEPFPFLRLPAELRLHVYSFLLSPGPHIILDTLPKPATPPRLNIMRTNRQIHHETSKFFYGNRRIFIRVGPPSMGTYGRPGKLHRIFQDPQTIATINPAIVELLKELEIEMFKTLVGNMYPPESWTSPMSHVFDGLKLERVRITFNKSKPWALSASAARNPAFLNAHEIQYEKLERFGRWLINQIPASVNVSWSREDAAVFFNSTAVEQRLHQAIQDRVLSGTDEHVTRPV